MSAPGSLLCQGRIIHKLVMRFPSARALSTSEMQPVPPPPPPQAQRQPGWVLNRGQGRQMGAPMGRQNSGQCSQQLSRVQSS